MIRKEILNFKKVFVFFERGKSKKKKKKFFIFWFCDVQVAQVLLTLPYSFAQLGVVSGVIFQVFYGLLGSYTAYLISILYIEYRSRKEKENVSFKNHVIQVRYPRNLDFLPPFSTLYSAIFVFTLDTKQVSLQFLCSGLKCWKAYWVHTGKP